MSRTTEIMGKPSFEPKLWGKRPAETLVILDKDDFVRLASGDVVAINLDRIGISGGGILEIIQSSDPLIVDKVFKVRD